jgi:beta-phosphoglucomutase family hydrolase
VNSAENAPRRPDSGSAGSPRGARALGLTDAIRACLFDLDGVLTRTAEVHARAWKAMFDDFLRANADGRAFQPFDIARDYEIYVDGKPRDDGTRSFLASRGIDLPDGDPGDPPGTPTVRGLGATKNREFHSLLEAGGLKVYEGSIDYVRAARAEGLRCAVVTSSANCQAILSAAGITDLFDTTIDGNDVENRHLRGKPAPDSYRAAAEALQLKPGQAAVYEDALAGVEAGRAGGFGRVIGVDRLGDGQAAQLAKHGADIVVQDLSELMAARG